MGEPARAEETGRARPAIVLPSRLYGVWWAQGGDDRLGSLAEHLDYPEARGLATWVEREIAEVALEHEVREFSKAGIDLDGQVVLIGVSPVVLETLATLALDLLQDPRDVVARYEARARIREFVSRATLPA